MNSHGAGTEQVAEAVARRLVALVESTDDAIISTTLEGTIDGWNPAAQALFGYRAEEMLGRPVDVLVPPRLLEEEQANWRRVRGGAHLEHYQTARVRKDGSEIPVAITVSPIIGPEQPTGGVSMIVRDVTQRSRTEELAERERRFVSSLIEAMPGVFYHYDGQRRFLRWNQNFEKISGYSRQEIETMHPLDFFAGEDRGLVERRIEEVFSQGEANVEAAFVSKQGVATPFYLTGKRITVDGKPHLIGVGIDVSARKQAEGALKQSEERYRSTLDTIMESCQLLDFDWRYLYLNPAAAGQNRRPNAELLGQRMPDVWPGIEGSAVFKLLRGSMESRLPAHEEIEFSFADGVTRWFDVRAQPVPEGLFVLSIDVSERKRAERALQELNENLETMVADRTVELESAKRRAEESDQLKSAFLATMSHELRTPLNSIIGFTGIVLKGMAGPLNAEQQKQLGMVQGSARHLLELINDVLDLSKIEAGQLEVHPAPFDLKESVERVAASVLPLAQKKGLALRVVVPPQLDALVSDRRRVEQIVLNLLHNAIKFTDRGEVSCTVAVAPSAVHIVVNDTGIGMKTPELSKLFQPFHQIDSGLQRQHEGTGLGLAISRRLAGLLGGSVHASSVFGQGSTFTVFLPIKGEVMT